MPLKHNIQRRTFLSCLATLAITSLPACTQIHKSATPQNHLTRRQINKIPYASIGVSIDNASRSLLILGRKEGEQLHWISADRSVLVTQQGRLVKTFGFPEELRQTQHIGTDPVAQGLHKLSGETIQHNRIIDIVPEDRFGINVESQFKRMGKEGIKILEVGYNTVLIQEQCYAPLLDWKCTNYYWADEIDGFIWKSHQSPTPATPAIDIEIFKALR